MNDSDTEFVAEDESITSTNIFRKEEIVDQSSFASVPKASSHILSTQNEDEIDTLGQGEPNSAPATQRTSNQSPSPANQRTSNQSPSPANQCTANQSPAAATQHTSNQSPAAATQRTADQSSAAVVTRRTSNQPSKSIPPPTVTLPKNTKKRKQMINDQRQNEKEKGQCSIRQEQHKPEKGQCPARRRQNKEEKSNSTEELKWEDKEKPMTKKESTLEAEILVDLDHGSTPFGIFQTVTGMNELLEIIVVETNRYAAQKCLKQWRMK